MSHSLPKNWMLALAALAFVGCSSKELQPPKPEAINFEQISKDPKEDIKATLKVDNRGSGIKDTKKFVIGAFQVRFRSTLTANLKLKDRNCNGTAMDVYGLTNNGENIFQSVTEDLYKKFVADLQQRGIEVVNFSEIQKNPEFQVGLKGPIPSGKLVELTSAEISNPFYEDSVQGRIPVGNIFGQQTTAQYLIFNPNEVPNFEYDTGKGGEDNYDLIVLPGNLPSHRMDAASAAGAGVMTVGLEVELMKFNYDACVIKNVANITHSPMVRTRLTAFSAFPAGAKKSFGIFGRSINNGIIVTPKSRGGKHGSGFISSMFNSKEFGTRWVEVADDSVAITGDHDVSPVADKFPAAFKKSTNAHVQMIMSIIDHPSDY